MEAHNEPISLLHKKKVFHSIIKKYFPIDLLINIDEVTMAHDIDNNSKGKEIVSMLKSKTYDVPFNNLGSGTNRYGIQIEGYAIKIALDAAGKIDNKREFKYCNRISPYVAKIYECLPTGLIASLEYLTIFSIDDFYDRQNEMREILERISENFLIGDVGISTKNYVNWGIRTDGSIAILDYAYIYDLTYKGFRCVCDDEGILEYDRDFNYLICPFCRKKFTFADIRRRITRADEINEIGDISTTGYILHSAEEELPVDPIKSPSEVLPVKKKKKRVKPPISKQNFDITNEEQLEIKREYEKFRRYKK